MAGEDFVQVKLSATGEAMAGAGGTLSISKGRRSFTFKAGVAQRIERSWEWNVVLAGETFQGKAIFEIVTAGAPAAAPAPALTAMEAATEHGEAEK
jgi:putative intracellular protease/amidase